MLVEAREDGVAEVDGRCRLACRDDAGRGRAVASRPPSRRQSRERTTTRTKPMPAVADDHAGRHPGGAAARSRRRDAAALADVRAAGEAVPAQRDRRLRRAEVRLCLCRRSAARGGQGRRAPHRARPPGRGARVPRPEPRITACAAVPGAVDIDETIDVEVPQQAVRMRLRSTRPSRSDRDADHRVSAVEEIGRGSGRREAEAVARRSRSGASAKTTAPDEARSRVPGSQRAREDG